MNPSCLINMQRQIEYTEVNIEYLEQLEKIATIAKILIDYPAIQQDILNKELPNELNKLKKI